MPKKCNQTLKQKLKDYCKTLNIEYVGIAPKGPYNKLKELLESRRNRGYFTEFEEQDLQKRIDPSLTMPDLQSIIVCLFPYFIGDIKNSNISKYTYSTDYHIVIKEKLHNIAEFLEKNINNFSYKCFTDNGPLVDRYLAYKAGLGYFGLNSMLINDKYGSYVFIGYILNNYHFEQDKPMDKTCIKCGECISKCPGSAILKNYELDVKRCVSYLTQKKVELTKQDINILQDNEKVFGCDICQEVCPHNKNISKTQIQDFMEQPMYNIDYDVIEKMSNREFKRRYGNKAFAWRGKNIIMRNFDILKDKYKKKDK